VYKKETLKNGLTLLKVPIPSAQSVLVDIFVKVGSRSEDKRINGISHFLEHLFFKGSRLYPTAQKLSHALDAIGAEYNANTGKEHTQYYIKAAKKHLKFIFEVLSDMLQRPIFAAEEIEREKGVIIEEINMYEDTPMRHVEDVLEEVMWPRHPLGRNIAGTRDVIRKISRQDILDYVGTYYKPKNLIIAVTGSYDEKLLDKMIRQYWNALADGNFPKWERAKYVQKKSAVRVEPKKTEQYHLALGFRSYDHNHPKDIPQMILATILGGGMSSRLFTEIRERQGWAYYVRATPCSYQDTGNFVIQAGVRVDKLQDVVRTLVRELRKIKDEPIPARELKKAKEYLKGTLTLSLEAHEAKLGWYLEQVAFRKEILEPAVLMKRIDAVTAAGVKKVARDIFQNKKLNLSVIGPKFPEAKLRRLLLL